jgi:acyl-CoA synthetase (AMP-forming)/AMP-acid ligase II
VVVGGENVHPAEVEAVIEEVDGVTEAAVVGVPDDELGQVLAAFVVGTAPAEAVLAHCAAVLPSYKVPRSVTPVDDLPRTGTGKVVRSRLVHETP